MSKEGLVKVHVSLPNHWMVGGESMWAQPIGSNIYLLENIPFFSYGLNFRDEVKAFPDDDGILEIVEVVKQSGNKTIRITFERGLNKEKQSTYMEKLRALECSLERWDDSYLSLNVKINADFNAIYDQLDLWSEQDVLAFETCEKRMGDSFDDAPE